MATTATLLRKRNKIKERIIYATRARECKV